MVVLSTLIMAKTIEIKRPQIYPKCESCCHVMQMLDLIPPEIISFIEQGVNYQNELITKPPSLKVQCVGSRLGIFNNNRSMVAFIDFDRSMSGKRRITWEPVSVVCPAEIK